MTPHSDPAKTLTDLRPKDQAVRVMPLGGVGEIGMNCCLIEYNGEILMVDCGQMMPDEDMLGVDYVVPDIQYVLDRIDKFVGIVITHAHEDHIGALPYILPQLPPQTPVYAGELCNALLKEKLKEHGLKPNLKVYHARSRFALGKSFMVEPIAVTHSMMDSYALAVSTPIGTLIHSGDFKIDPCPMDGVCFDMHAFSRYAEGEEQGVLALLADSTNTDRPGSCPSESTVIPTLERLVREATGQIILCCFASSLHRVQVALNIAADYNKVAIAAGLNMERNIRVAKGIGILDVPCRFEPDIDRVEHYPANQRLILTTGSQGEPMSALTRMALGTHRAVSIKPGDTVIISARLIPGNEKAIYRMINHLVRRGAKVYYPGNTPNVHASGHGYRDDARHMLNLVNPKYLVPVHGEYRHLHSHTELAIESGMLPEEIKVIENGDCLEITPHHAQVIGKIPHGRVFIDGKGVGDVEDVVIRERRFLADDGVVMVILSVDRETGEVLGGPYIHSRGFTSELVESGVMMEEASKVVLDAYNAMDHESQEESSVVQAAVKKALKSYLKKKVARFPVILPVIMEI
ncbi:RNase J family beta-CASP ribonuclease [bacterium]|nr:RNase J family beta-CASP ribonuclease [bacterium]